MSKGSAQRPVDKKAFNDNYDRIFNRDKSENDRGLIELPEWTEAIYPKDEDEDQVMKNNRGTNYTSVRRGSCYALTS